MAERLSPATHAYIGIAPCGCRMAATVDDPAHPRRTAKAITEFVREGLHLERMTIEDFRQGGLSSCPRCRLERGGPAEQLPLLTPADAAAQSD